MADVIDDSVSWEQRRELRRKKRQELLAEADRLVKKTDDSPASTRVSNKYADDEDDEFEKGRQRRRREREERRKKEREELEKQLKEEEEARNERDRRREERRRLREEADETKEETPTKSIHITKTIQVEEKQEEPVAPEVEEEDAAPEQPVENGKYEDTEEVEDVKAPSSAPSESDYVEEDSRDEEEQEEQEEEEQEELTNGHDVEQRSDSKASVTTVTLNTERSSYSGDSNGDTDEVQEKLKELKLKRQESEKKRYERSPSFDEDDSKSKLQALEEKKKMREQKRLEEEERQKEEALKREAEYQEKLRIEREERTKRRQEAEVKRQQYRKQLTQSEEDPKSPLSPKSLSSPLVFKKSEPGDVKSDKPAQKKNLNSTASAWLSKKEAGLKEMDRNQRPPAVPRRTQSARIKLSQYSPARRGLKVTDKVDDDVVVTHQPSRPLARKNQTRRSLDAMEKQAGELLDFLTELEGKKASSSTSDLLQFLDSPEKRSQSEHSSPVSENRITRNKRISVKDRAKLFLKPDIKEEEGEGGKLPHTHSAPSLRQPPPQANRTYRQFNGNNNNAKIINDIPENTTISTAPSLSSEPHEKSPDMSSEVTQSTELNLKSDPLLQEVETLLEITPGDEDNQPGEGNKDISTDKDKISNKDTLNVKSKQTFENHHELDNKEDNLKLKEAAFDGNSCESQDSEEDYAKQFPLKQSPVVRRRIKPSIAAKPTDILQRVKDATDSKRSSTVSIENEKTEDSISSLALDVDAVDNDDASDVDIIDEDCTEDNIQLTEESSTVDADNDIVEKDEEPIKPSTEEKGCSALEQLSENVISSSTEPFESSDKDSFNLVDNENSFVEESVKSDYTIELVIDSENSDGIRKINKKPSLPVKPDFTEKKPESKSSVKELSLSLVKPQVDTKKKPHLPVKPHFTESKPDVKPSMKELSKSGVKQEIDTAPTEAAVGGEAAASEPTRRSRRVRKRNRVEQLNKHITESPKPSKAAEPVRVGSLDSRMEKYTKQAAKQDLKKTGADTSVISRDVSNRRNKWERGEVATPDKTPKKSEPVIAGVGNISSRKNMWERGAVGTSSKSNKGVADIKVDFSSRKNKYLETLQQSGGGVKKAESPVGIKTGVANRLNKWEKGEVGTKSPLEKQKSKGDLPASGVGDRLKKWETTAATDTSSKSPASKASVRVTTDVSNRKNLWESKASSVEPSEVKQSTSPKYEASSESDRDEPEQRPPPARYSHSEDSMETDED